ncbi:MAG TPA: glycosyltransferase family 2 protein [Candidatus Nitrosopolaris sp.]|nr:glycosyltransferase family 2 protein [Candidatus Nitrosopolaris sp.]
MIKVTVGIPSFNEERNITHLLQSIVKQKSENFAICEIIISDDSTDNTVKLIEEFATNNSEASIRCLHHASRMGVASAWNEIFQNAKGDVVVMYDGDVIPQEDSIREMLSALDGRVVLSISNSEPTRSVSVAGRAATCVSSWLRSVRNRRLSQYTAIGRGLSIRANIARKIEIPSDIIAVDLYLECKVLEFKFDVAYNDRSVVYFCPPGTIADFNSQVLRSLKGHKQIRHCIEKFEIRLPLEIALRQTVRVFLSDPLGALAVAACYSLLPYHKHRLKGLDSSKWHIAQSTKSTQNLSNSNLSSYSEIKRGQRRFK